MDAWLGWKRPQGGLEAVRTGETVSVLKTRFSSRGITRARKTRESSLNQGANRSVDCASLTRSCFHRHILLLLLQETLVQILMSWNEAIYGYIYICYVADVAVVSSTGLLTSETQLQNVNAQLSLESDK